MTDYWNLQEIVETAYRQLPRNEWDFIVGGTETETTLRRNRQALDALALRPRVLRDVSSVDRSAQLFGKPLRLPLLMAPIGKQLYNGGARTVAKAAADSGCAFALSSVNGMTSIEDVAEAAPHGFNIYQLYVRGDREWVRHEVDRAHAAGCSAFCVTVDTAMISRRERDLANRYTSPNRRQFEGAAFQAAFGWDDLARVRDACTLPLIVKGITAPEDAELAIEHGVDAIYVSNHGGRQLDHCLGAIDAFREVAAAVGSRATMIMDGGVCRGTDVVKAVAAGATVVGIGRLHCLALAAAGEAGVTRMLEILDDEIEIAMGLSGAASLAGLTGELLRSIAPVDGSSSYARAFPLLTLPIHSYR